jgi:pimeloyl-ACP methyl ester carboxylesterase
VLRDGLVERPDGRVVAWSEWGDPAGRPLLRAHGTPGSRLTGPFDPELYERIQAHVVTFDRPGYGRSSVHREGTVLSVADDALAVADAVGWDRFAVHGGSGGGPYALAVGFRGGDRVSAVGLVNPARRPSSPPTSTCSRITARFGGARRRRGARPWKRSWTRLHER